LNIKQEIVKIIHEYDFIVVPGLGAFMGEYSKPYFNAIGDIIAGHRSIHFEPIIKKDIDNKLFNILVEKISIPQNYVLIEYSDFLEKLSFELKSTGKYDWEGLGSFFQHADGTIDYFADKSKHTSFQEISNHKETVQIDEAAKVNETKVTFFEQENIKTEPISDDLDNHNSKAEFIKSMETTKPFKVLLYMVPFFLLLAGLSWAVFFKPNEKKDVKQSMMAEIDSLSKLQEDIEMEPVYKSDPPIQESTYSIDRSEDVNKFQTEPKKSNKKDYEQIKDRAHGKIIPIGVFTSRETADNVVTKFAESGVPVRTKAYKGKFKVFVVSYSDTQTEEFKQKIQELNSFIQ
jgi:CCDC81-like prokaryotic HU domain 1